jgi:hypothetical protein
MSGRDPIPSAGVSSGPEPPAVPRYGATDASSVPEPPAAPRYGTADVGLLVPDAFAALTHAPRRLPGLPLPERLRAVVVLVVDGLGRRLLDVHGAIAPTLAGAPGCALDAPFPSTTPTSLATIGTGLAPGEHGLVGSAVAVASDDRPLLLLTWSWTRQDLDLDARADVVPETFQPRTTCFEAAAARGVRAVTVLRPEFTTSGLTRAALRGGEVLTAVGREATVDVAVGAAAAADHPTVVYAHHGDLDAIGHLTGPGSDAWCTELAAIDATLTRVAEDLPPGVAVVVTADHGMVHVPPDGFVELADAPGLLDGVRVLAGDPRARQLHTVPGAVAEVAAAWREATAGVAAVLTRDEAITAGWFGPSVSRAVRGRVGDVVVSAIRTDVAWVHRDADLFGGRLPGQHGALGADELQVPALVLGG